MGLSYSLIKAEERSSPKEKLASTWRKVDFQLALKKSFETGKENSGSVSKMSQKGTKSVAKALLFSAAIPGMGEFYNGSYIKGLVFLAVEAAAWPAYFHFHNKGEDLEEGFIQYAEGNWEPEEYWNWLSEISGIFGSDMDALREYEHENFSHFLPEEKNQQYYENIGKYNQFNIGWNDTQNGYVRDSDFREKYTLMRKDANDNFKRATNFATLVLFNHVFSALDAALTTKRYNKRIISACLRMKNMKYGNEIIPALALGVIW